MTMEKILTHAMLMTWTGTDASLPPVILMAHQDVVPVNPGTDADWTHGPFGGVVADGYIWGRGAMDDKGSLIAILEAGEALAKSSWAPKRTVIFAFGHDEEVSGAGAQEIFALLKSRNVTPAMVLDEGYAVLDNYPLTGKPAALIGVAEKGYISLQITATTEGGHSSRPPRESGAVRIARALVALEENQMPADLSAPPFNQMIEAVAADLPFTTRLAFANQWLLGSVITGQVSGDASANAIVRTTTAPTMMTGSIKDNVLPQRASAVVNFRIHPNDTIAIGDAAREGRHRSHRGADDHASTKTASAPNHRPSRRWTAKPIASSKPSPVRPAAARCRLRPPSSSAPPMRATPRRSARMRSTASRRRSTTTPISTASTARTNACRSKISAA